MSPEASVSIGFSGTRQGMSEFQMISLVDLLEVLAVHYRWLHHGCCLGADAEAHSIAKRLGYKVAAHPPTLKATEARFLIMEADYVYPREDYLVRNREIVNCSARLIAAPHTNSNVIRSGTWFTIRYARELNRAVDVLQR